jgi:hypothetical protein
MAISPHELAKRAPLVSHHEVKETFADQMSTVFFDGSTLRIDFAATRLEEPTGTAAAARAEPKRERHIVCRLVLTSGCAVDLMNQMKQMADELAKAGVLTATPPSRGS